MDTNVLTATAAPSSCRRDFLAALFRILERDSIPYCVLRNYQDIYDDPSSDIDVAVEPKHLRRFRRALNDAAEFSDYSLIHQARYINYSYVYWHSSGSFVRVDVETEVRWRVFPILSSASVVGLRRKHGEFYVPHPRHESVILFVAAIWRRTLRERYREQLAALYDQITDPEELTRTFRAAFGAAGGLLADCQAHIRERLPEAGLWREARMGIVRNAFSNAPNRRALLAYFGLDVHRFCFRVRYPPGISLLYVSTHQPSDDTDKLFSKLEFLYPTQKSAKHVFEVPAGPRPCPRLPWRLQFRRLYTLFKGGLFMRYYHVAQDEEIPKAIRTLAKYLYPSRAFFCAQNSTGENWLGHVKSGFMTQFDTRDGLAPGHHRVIQFITTILGRRAAGEELPERSRGLFVVLLGLDGSGKTNLARNLCCLAAQQDRFSFARYFHWRPALLKKSVFPLPDFRAREGRRYEKPNIATRMLSGIRLGKNVFLANVAHFFRIRPLVRKNGLVLLDRYFYNYYLDPASVRYYAPQWLVEKVRRFFPRPDLIVTLRAEPEVLLARKQELTESEVKAQNAVLEQLQLDAKETLRLDASASGSELANVVMQKIQSMAGPKDSKAEESGLQGAMGDSRGLNSVKRDSGDRVKAFMRTIFSLPRLALCGLVLLLMAAPSFFTISYLKKQAKAITDDTLPGLSLAGAANANLAQAFNRTLMLLLSENPAQRDQLKKEIEAFSQKITAYLDAYRQSIYSQEDRAQFEALMNNRAGYLRVRQRTLELSEMNKRAEAVALYNSELLPAYQSYREAGDKLFLYNTKQGEHRGKTIIAGFTITQFLVGAMGVLVFVIGFAFGTSRRPVEYAFGEYA